MDKNRYFQIRSGKYIKTKVTDIQRLYSKWLWLVMAGYKPLLADAEILKDISQHLIRSNFSTNDFCQVEQTLTQILRNEITG